MVTQLHWNDVRRVLSLRLAPGSRMMPPARRPIAVKLNQTEKNVVFDGNPLEVSF